ncbi:MAG: peptidoglycan DD-metalloendopeptidase family protein, partial [Clostridia bacterium]|nr:peptidoglycan DD-metalloendopeptidase family protein [Clostridia bacterium]
TEAISAKDKQLMNALSDEIAELDAINKENEELLQSQVEIKNEVKKQQDDLKSQQAEEKKIFDEIAKEEAAAAKQKAANEAEIQSLKNQLETSAGNIVNAGSSFINTTTGFMWPVPGAYIITSGFRTAKRPRHNGMDISGGGVLGKPFVAITDGEVMQVVNSWTAASGRSGNASYGNYCTVDHGIITISGVSAKYAAIYAHATSIAVSVKQKVKKGQVLGYVGSTGNSTGPHLHIGIWKNGSFTNPQPLLK